MREEFPKRGLVLRGMTSQMIHGALPVRDISYRLIKMCWPARMSYYHSQSEASLDLDWCCLLVKQVVTYT